MQPSSGTPCCARPRSRISRQLGAAGDVDLVDHRAHHPHPVPREEGHVERDLVDGAADPALADHTTGASSSSAARALESPTTAPTPAWPVPSMTTRSLPRATRS